MLAAFLLRGVAGPEDDALAACRGDPTTLVAALESDCDSMPATNDTCKGSSFEKAALVISKCVRWRLKPHAA